MPFVSGTVSRCNRCIRFLTPLYSPPLYSPDTFVFPLVQDNTTKPKAEGVWEAHRKYIDVQFVAAGVEQMGWAKLDTLAVKKPYDADADYALFDGPGDFLTVPAGSFTIFFPKDGHIPGIAVNDQPSAVRKIVVKVAVD